MHRKVGLGQDKGSRDASLATRLRLKLMPMFAYDSESCALDHAPAYLLQSLQISHQIYVIAAVEVSGQVGSVHSISITVEFY
jgi:hypothetical protein